MKINVDFKYSLLMLGLCFFIACKKDDAGTTPPPSAPPTLYEKIAGKWEVNMPAGRVKQNAVNNHAAHKVQGAPKIISIEFLTDSTYIAMLNSSEIMTGKFNATDTTAIDLTGLGMLTELTFNNEQINFSLFWNGSTIVITANKAAEIPLTDSTKLLCRNWLLTENVSGRATHDFSSNEQSKMMLRFSSAGTYLVSQSTNDSLNYLITANWHWHTNLTNTFVYTWGQGPLMDNRPVNITELTSGSLTMEETYYEYSSYEYDIDGNLHGYGDSVITTRIYNFIPAN